MTRKYRRCRGGVRRTTSRSTPALPVEEPLSVPETTLVTPPPRAVARYQPKNRRELRKSVTEYPKNKSRYGNINTWDVTLITDMDGIFASLPKFNEDISGWDVGNVTRMSNMFYQAKSFNQNISGWNVSNVTSINHMFHEAKAFNQPLNSWNVRKVDNAVGMFMDAKAFNQPLNSWDVRNITDMAAMFKGASAFNQPLDSWDVSGVKRMDSMFEKASTFNQPLDSWDVGNVKYMNSLFVGCSSFRQSLINWNIENVTGLFNFSDNYNFEWPLFKRRMIRTTYLEQYKTDLQQVFQSTHDERYQQLLTEIDTLPVLPTSSDDFNPFNIFRITSLIPLEESTNRANPNDDEGYDFINLENKKVSDYLNSDPNNVVFYMNGQVILLSNKTNIRNILLGEDSPIKYKCREVSTELVPQLENVDRTNPCVSLNSLGSTSGGLVLLGAMKSLLEDASIRTVEIATPEIDNAVSTASLSVLGPEPSAVGASHCQEGQGDKIYALKKMTIETSGGNRRRTKRSGKRRTKKIIKRTYHNRNTRK